MSEPAAVVAVEVREALAGQIDAANSEDDMIQTLGCPICHNPAYAWNETTASVEAVVTVCCGNLVHRGCHQRSLELNKKCPQCQRASTDGEQLRPASRHEHRMLEVIKVDCPQGCGQQLQFQRLWFHIYQADGCARTPLRCTNGQCDTHFLRLDAAKHHGECAHLLIPCGICSAEVPRGQRQGHQRNVCPMAQIKCDFCRTDGIRRCRMEAHHTESCTGFVPMRVLMQVLQEHKLDSARRESALLRQVHALQSAQHCLLADAGLKVHVVQVPQALGELLGSDGARHEVRAEGTDFPIVLLRKEGQLLVDFSEGKGERMAVSVAGRSTEVQKLVPEDTAGEPGAIAVVAPECPAVAGEYTKLKERVDGKAVWGKGQCRIMFSTAFGNRWLVSTAAGATQSNSWAGVQFYSQTVGQGPAQIPFLTYQNPTYGHGQPARGTSLTAVARKPDFKPVPLCPLADVADVSEVCITVHK
eukprot:TRINITY_DN1919_c0_g1_i2.p1 TRINITY_DN1919_c0_g1~~TRINITY_DN1919_c0_g1_i2.p1  ORF type:complete len:472 (+),score=85.36 TRINITY_DN1919_c0_g1_i2:96-1511(+)